MRGESGQEERWLVQAFSKLQKYFDGLTKDNLPALHVLATSNPDQEWVTAWGMIRRLTGIRPVILPSGTDASKLAPLPEATVAEIYKVDEKRLADSIGVLQLAWHHLLVSEDMPSVELSTTSTVSEKEKPEAEAAAIREAAVSGSNKLFNDEQLALLQLASFPTSIFDIHKNTFDAVTEIEWFTGRIKELRKVLDEPMAKSLVQQGLLNELQLRRISHQMATMKPSEKEYPILHDIKSQLEKTYGEQWSQIEEMCPFSISSTSRKQTINNLSDIVRLYLDYKKDESNRPRDGIFTDEEIQIMFRTSAQGPDPRYRFGWVLACNEAKFGIGDPKWKRKMNDIQCKTLDTAFAYAVKRMYERYDVFKPDLELDSEAGEYPPLHMVPDGVTTEPELDLMETPVEIPAAEIEEPKGVA